MDRKRWGRLMTIAVLAGTMAACDTSTGPDALSTFDTDRALSDYQTVDAILSSNAWQNFQVMGKKASLQRVGPVPSFALQSAMEMRSIEGATDARDYIGRWTALVAGMSPTAAEAPIISDTHRGKTFVYDPSIEDYAVSERSGAPSNGTRFITYELDSSGTPIVENETGYFDLIDEGDNSAEDIALKLVVVEDGSTILNYATRLDENGPNGTVTVDGYLTDGSDRLDFSIDAKGSDTPTKKTLDVTFEMRVDNRDFVINGSVRGMDGGASDTGDIDVSVRHGSESLRVDVDGDESSINGTFYLNGEVFATVTGDPDSPTFQGASGDPLVEAEILVLIEMMDTVEDVFDFFEDLLDPIDDLLVLAVIL